jgi:hypothetical protein
MAENARDQSDAQIRLAGAHYICAYRPVGSGMMDQLGEVKLAPWSGQW